MDKFERISDQIVKVISENSRFLILSHIYPEGDCIGSLLAFARLLRAMGKECNAVNAHPVPERYRFLPESSLILKKPLADFIPDITVILDTPILARADPDGTFIIPGAVTVNIDHHFSNENFGTYNYVDDKACSAGVLVFRFYKRIGVVLDTDAATQIYCAIVTDTGRFRFSNTDSEALNVCAQLVENGVDPEYIATNLYYQNDFGTEKALGYALSSLELSAGGKISSLELSRDMIARLNNEPYDTEGIADHAVSIRGVEIGIFFRQDSDGVVKVSFRSSGNVDVNGLAAIFGGGGHLKAAGARIEGQLDEIRRKVLKEAERWMTTQT